MLIDASHPEETRVVVVDGHRVDQFDFESINKKQIAGNVYLARVTRVEPSLQAAFVEYGGNRHGFLPFSEIHPDYYQIPHADRAALMADAARALQEESEEERPARGARNGNGGASERNGERSGEGRREDRNGRNGRREGGRDDRNGRDGRRDRKGGEERAAREGGEPQTFAREEGAAPDPSSYIDPAPPRAAPERDGGRGRGRGRGRDRRRGEGRGGWVEILEREVTLEGGGSAQLYRLERRAFSEQGEGEPVRAEDKAEAESPILEVALESGEIARLYAPGPRRGRARPMAASPDDSLGGDSSSGRRARYLRRRRTGERRKDESSANALADEEAPDAAPDQAAEEFAETSAPEAESGEGEAFVVEEAGRPADDGRDEAPRRFSPRGRYKIQDVIKKRQILLVQVVKEERGNKGAALTTYVSLAGRYCVLMPNTARGGGISRKITEAADRKRLKEAAEELDVPKGMGLIVRTAGADRTKAEIKRDYDYLIRQWSAIRDLTLASMAPKLVYEEGDLIKRSIRDLYSRDIEEIVVEGEDGYREAKEFMKMLTPSHAKNVKPYRDDVPLFIRSQVESQLTAMFNPIVQLRSGGYIVINTTEALVAIDVNSGRSTREHSIEDTALKTNLEAAEEAARQMRLRDLAGLLVIDFIDMDDPRNDRAVERKLKDCLKNDRARMQIGRISNFGLLEMSRQRLRPGLLEASTTPCPHCQGAGHVRSDESLALSILREAEEEGVREPGLGMKIAAPVAIANYLINHKRERILSLERRYRLLAYVEADPTLQASEHRIERFAIAETARLEAGPVAVDSNFVEEDEEDLAPAPVQREPRERAPRRIEIEEGVRSSEPSEPEEETVDSAAPREERQEERQDERRGRNGRNDRRRGRDRGERGERKPRDSDPLPVIDLGEAPTGEAEPLLAPEFPAPKAEPEAASGERDGGRKSKGRERGRSRRPAPEAQTVEAAAPAPVEAAPVEVVAEAAPASFAEAGLGATAEALLSRPDALDLAVEKVFAPPAKKTRKPRVAKAKAPEAAPAAEASAPVASAPEAAPVEAPAAEAAPTVAAPAPAPEATEQAASEVKSDRPKRKGWWSRG